MPEPLSLSTELQSHAGRVAFAVYPRWSRAIKRLMDVVGAAVGLTLTAPVMLTAIVLVKATSKGPAFYVWRIAGAGGRPVTSWKIRTMHPDADARKAALAAFNEMKGPAFKMTRDPRVTPVGRVLRRFSVDELPQLASVLLGDMSLVGPRPPLWHEWLQFRPEFRRKMSVKPGLTCLWQVRGRNAISDYADWVEQDLEYIDNWSLWLDVKILLATIPTVILGTGK